MCFRWLCIKTHRSVQMAMRLPFCDPWCCRVTSPLKLESTNDVGEDDIIAISNCKGKKRSHTAPQWKPYIFPYFSHHFPHVFPTCSIDFPYPVQHMAPGKDLFHQRQLVHHGGSPHQAVVAHGKDQHESRPWKKSLEMGGILWELSGNM